MILTAGGFKILRDNFGRLTQEQVDGFNFLISEIDKDKSISYAQAAYILATTWHETAHTMQPVKERGSDAYLRSKRYFPYIGYGYVQLTWRDNYERVGKLIGVDLIKNPELALRADIAAKILIQGIKQGWFTGKKLADYIHQSKKDYVGARRIINGTDKAQKIANEALIIEKALRSL